MSLRESAKTLVEVSQQAKVDINPFVQSVDGILGLMDQLVSQMDNANPAISDMFAKSVSELHNLRSEFVEVASAELEQLHQNIVQMAQESADLALKIDDEKSEADRVLGQLEADYPAMAEKARQDLLASLPPPPEPVAINPGEELVARLLELGAPPKPPSKVMPSPGNIWENWKQGPGKT